MVPTHTEFESKRGRIPLYRHGVLPRTVKKPGSVDGLLTVITVRAHQTERSKEGGAHESQTNTSLAPSSGREVGVDKESDPLI